MCPLCNQVFSVKPELKTNTLLSVMASQFRAEEQKKVKRETGEIPCDICLEPKTKALKSCLVCLASYCDLHLEPHQTVPGLKRHQLINPVQNLEERMCPKHDKPLELFCRTDSSCVCSICPVLEHNGHEFVSLKEEFDRYKESLKQNEAENEEKTEQRLLKIQEIRRSLNLSQKAAERETSEGIQAFDFLIRSVEKSRESFVEEVEKKLKKTEKEAEDLIRELEQEMAVLKARSTKVEQLVRSEDHLRILQTSLEPAPNIKDWTEVTFDAPSFEGSVVRAMSRLENTLEKELKKFFESELTRVRQCAVDITLDPDTANPHLVISEDLKRVHDGDVEKLPDDAERFSFCRYVLGKQSFSSGRFYFEVQVQEKTKWDLGVIRKSVNKKGRITLSPEDGFWAICLRDGEYRVSGAPQIRLELKSKPQKVGVFVDYEEGLVTFFDADTAALLYTFTDCGFSEKLLPYLGPCFNDTGKNTAPMVISGGLRRGLFYRFRFQQME